MSDELIGNIVVPGLIALLLFGLFTYLYRQSRQTYFRAWQMGWAALCLEYGMLAWVSAGPAGVWAFLAAELCACAAAGAIYVSPRLFAGHAHLHWSDVPLAGLALALVAHNVLAHTAPGGRFVAQGRPHLTLGAGIAVLLALAAVRFYRLGRERDAVGLRLLGGALVLWVPFLLASQFESLAESLGSGGMVLAPLPQMLTGIAMVVVLFEQERRTVEENVLAFSRLADPTALLTPEEVAPALTQVLERVMALAHSSRGALCVAERWRPVLPSVACGFAPDVINMLEGGGTGEYLSEAAYRRGGLTTFRNVAHMAEPLPAGPPEAWERCRAGLLQFGIESVAALSLQTRDHNFGVVLLPLPGSAAPGSTQARILLGAAMQIGRTLENYVVVHQTQRRTREYELLTQVGQVVSSRLDPDEVLRAIHNELGLLFDTDTFYVAFQDGDEIRFEFETVQGQVRPKRARKMDNGMTEYVIRTGEPLLVRTDMEQTRARLGITYVPERPAKSYVAVPICVNNRAVGMMAAMNFDREFVYDDRDVELLQTAAGQVAVAMENARLFCEQQRRSRYLALLNNVSKAAISSHDAEQMLAEIVSEIQHNFDFDHLGIGMLDYVTKEIEIRAEAGSKIKCAGKRVPLGSGIIGRCARSNEMLLVQEPGDAVPQGNILPGARSVLCLPLSYSDSLLGVLNVESCRQRAFGEQEVLILRTLADLLATALHNAFVFQKLQQQSITDGLTGIKTRRFFLESLTSEWKRASRSGRPFSAVLIDLDKFKEVNDTLGHLEGDLVLARVGRLLEQKCRQSNVVARYGGDEFVILMPETGVEQAQILSERLRLWIATDPMLSERQITGSFGVASFPLHGATPEDVLRVADAGMYVAKHTHGGNCVAVAEEFLENTSAVAQRQLLTACVEGFLQREHTGPESVQELVGTLRKLCGPVESREALMEALLTLGRAAESREIHMAGMADRAAHYVEALGIRMGMPPEQVEDAVYAARVHDVGKLVIPEKILCKPGPLSEEEFYLIKMHPKISAEIVSCIPEGDRIRDIIKHHHERFDGTGYPDGLKGEQIPLGSRILSVVDAYLTMTCDRPFAPRLNPDEAMAELQRCSGTQFDDQVIGLFAQQLRGEKAAKVGS
jgi:diguanylate cyclase (GGDEF)-like protein